MTEEATGGCLCGAVRLVVDASPVTVRECWCRLCQSLGGGSGTVNVVFPVDAVRPTGPLVWYESIADSGTAMRRAFCPTCGTPVLSVSAACPELTVVRAGVLDEPARYPPRMVIWTDAAPPWATLRKDVPHHPGQPGAVPAGRSA